jgi:hypothetical protein
MSEIPGRLYRIAKSYLDSAKDRLSELDSAAQAELSRALPRENVDYMPGASDDPMERARAKIAAARGSVGAYRELNPEGAIILPPGESRPAPSNSTPGMDALQAAYKVIGVPMGSDFLTVQRAVEKLRQRIATANFPEGSPEQADAARISDRIENAYRVLQTALDPTEGRFDRLEI